MTPATPVVSRRFLLPVLLLSLLTGCASAPAPRGSGDLGVVIERSIGQVQVVNTTSKTALAKVPGLGDLSHASVVFSRDQRYAYVFGRDGGLTKVDILNASIAKRIVQAGNAIGGAISQDGKLVVAQNYEPGGIKAFDAETLELVADIPSVDMNGVRSKVVGLADLSGNRFAFSLFEAGEIWVADLSNPKAPKVQKYSAGKQPYDALVTPDGRYYIAGLFGEDGLAMLDTWQPEQGVQKILAGYGKGEQPLPVYKMPHLRGWSVAGGKAYLPAIGRHEVLVVDTTTWEEVGRIPVAGQPVFVMARPDGRQVWVNFAVPDYHRVQVIDTVAQRVAATLQPGKAVMHMEFTPRGESVWISCRDDDKVVVLDTAMLAAQASLPARAPSGIFFTARAQRMGF